MWLTSQRQDALGVAQAQRGTSNSPPAGGVLLPHPGGKPAQSSLLPGRRQWWELGRSLPVPSTQDPSQGPLQRIAPCRASGTEKGQLGPSNTPGGASLFPGHMEGQANPPSNKYSHTRTSPLPLQELVGYLFHCGSAGSFSVLSNLRLRGLRKSFVSVYGTLSHWSLQGPLLFFSVQVGIDGCTHSLLSPYSSPPYTTILMCLMCASYDFPCVLTKLVLLSHKHIIYVYLHGVMLNISFCFSEHHFKIPSIAMLICCFYSTPWDTSNTHQVDQPSWDLPEIQGVPGTQIFRAKAEKSWSTQGELITLLISPVHSRPMRNSQLASNPPPPKMLWIFSCICPLGLCKYFSGIYTRARNCQLIGYTYT